MIDESLLAIRLGVDHLRSNDWTKLREGLASAFYLGSFCSGYERWWMPLVLDWWSAEIEKERPPYRIAASERVQLIAKSTGLSGLEPLQEDKDSPGTRFWYRCLYSNRPVDPAFGFPLMPEWGQESWQEVDYLCLEEALRHSRDARLSASEKARLSGLLKGGR
jgi:hypothetical protein